MVDTVQATRARTAAKLRELGISAAFAAMLQAAVKLNLADALGDAPATPAELAAKVNAEPHTLGRLLRALASHEVFAQTEDGRYTHTDTSRLLRSDTPHSMRDMVLWGGAPWTWAAWPLLEQAVRTGKAVVPELYGKDFWTYLREDAPDDAAIFNRAMTQASALTSVAIAEALDLAGVETVADIGGGQGHLLRRLLERNPALHGVLFDIAPVIAAADHRLRDGDLAERCQLVPGDCLESIPVQADLYLIKQVLKWDDDSSVTALRNVARSARPGARVVVVQGLLDGEHDLRYATAMDLFVLLNVGGQEHTLAEFVDLFGRAGLEYKGVTQTRSPMSLIEATTPVR